MATRHTISHADELFAGNVHYEPYAGNVGGRRGVRLTHLFATQLGAVDTKDDDGICVAATVTAAGLLSATGALVSGGVATFDVPRNVTLTATSDLSAVTFTVTGEDEYGEALVEAMTGPTSTTKGGAKAFKSVSSISAGAAAASVTAGSGDVLGLPLKLATKGDVIAVSVDGVPETTLAVVAASATTATATTADVRGTVAPNTAPNGTRTYTVLQVVGDHSTKASVFGVDQYGG